jgi:hypothetical protein
MAVVEDLEGLGVLGPDQRHQLLVSQPLGLLSPNRHLDPSSAFTRRRR